MFIPFEPYHKRPIRFLEAWKVGGWRLKVYSLAYQRPLARSEVIEYAKARLWEHLLVAAQDKAHYQVGFLCINDGRGAVFAFVDFWADENELYHHVFAAPKKDWRKLEYLTPTGLIACVWDVALIAHERQAWVKAVLDNPGGPDLEQYLSIQMNEDI